MDFIDRNEELKRLRHLTATDAERTEQIFT